MNTPDSMDPYALILTKLEQQRSQLQAQLADIETTLATIKLTRERYPVVDAPQDNLATTAPLAVNGSTVRGNGVVIGSDAYIGLNIPEAVTMYLLHEKRDSASFSEITAALKAGGQASAEGENFGNVVFNALKRMEKRKEIARKNNRWALTSQISVLSEK